jgi:hypothetical protein
MLKVVLAFITAASILAAAFLVLPRVLLQSTTTGKSTANVPIGRPADADVTPGAVARLTPVPRRIQTFADIEVASGFRPLTPASLPNGYQPWEQYFQVPTATVVIAYRKAEGMYLFIVERKLDSNSFRGRGPTTCGTPPVRFPTPSVRRPDVNVAIPIGTTCAFYQSGTGGFGFAGRLLQGAGLNPAFMNLQPHQISYTTPADLQVGIEADQRDVSRDQLVQIAAGLR